MTDSALIIPTERPYNANSIKRALLTYDKVYLFSPDDRDIIPSNIYMQLTTGLPIGMKMGPIRPLGKMDKYDEKFEKIITDFSDAIKQGSLQILSTTEEHQTITIGAAPLYKDTPPPDFVFYNYRNLISSPEFISVASKGIDNTILTQTKNIEQLTPTGQEDSTIQMFINGQSVSNNYQKALYNGFCNSEEERLMLTRLCHARLGILMKSVGYCESKNISSFTTDPGIAGTIQLLERNYSKVVNEAQVEYEPLSLFNNLKKLENLVFSEYIDQEVFNNLSVRDVLKLRTKAWGKSNQGKIKLKSQLKLISLELKDPSRFEDMCKREIEEYLKQCKDFEHEANKLKIKLLCNLGAVLVGGTSGTTFLEQLITAPTIGLMVGIGSAIAFIYGEKRFPEILDILKKQEELQDLKGYSLYNPYKLFQ